MLQNTFHFHCSPCLPILFDTLHCSPPPADTLNATTLNADTLHNAGWHKLDIFQFVQPHEANSPSVSLSGKQTISTINGSGDQMAEANKLVAPTAGGLTAGEPPDEQLKCDLGFSPLYAVVSSSISFYLPCIIMVALYTRLYLVARKHVRDIRKICKPQLVTRRDENLAAAAQQKLAQQADSPLKNNQNLLTCVPNTGSNRSNRSSRSASALPVGTGVQQSQRSTTINQHVADHKAAITIGIILFVSELMLLESF